MVKFNFRLKPTSRAKVELIKQKAKAREEKLKAAVQYCIDNTAEAIMLLKLVCFLSSSIEEPLASG